ncbi:MAG: hypothetical protein IKL35_04185 [Muribaculaceae bacterium]|nr:hypothetical protein [Muribaculaceae bacterium]
MRKHFLKVSLIGLLAVSMPMSFTSCKDYDDDIEALENSNADLSNQLSALQAALTANQQAATAAQSAADAAKAAADAAQNSADAAAKEAAAAKQEAELAKKAAAEAKAEAIEEAIDQVKSMLSGYATSAQLATLAGTVEGIQKGLSTLEASLKEANAEIDENARAIEAIKVQVAALEKFQAETGKDITAIKADIEALKAQLNSKITKDEVNALLNEANAKLTKELNSAVSTLQGVISNRLSSITLVPNLYIDGIETIEFTSLKYTPLKQSANGLVSAGADVLVSSDENLAQYRLNPITTGLNDIDEQNIEFVALVAQARGVVEAPIAYVPGSATIGKGSLDNGILSVYAKKTITSSLNLSGDNIYTVALKVPIAKELCEDENTPEYVYSEYARLNEKTSTPKIAANPYVCTKTAGHNHYSDSVTMWASKISANDLVTKEVYYKDKLDLLPLVTGCLYEDAREFTKEQLAKFGLEFRFAIPTKGYIAEENNTDQQQFVALENGQFVYSKLPNGYTDNKACIGKEPIIRVSLVDVVNNKLVDQRYLKIKWIDKVLEPIDLGSREMTSYLACQDSIGMGLSWADFTNEFYGKIDMSKDQFTKVYMQTDPTVDINYTLEPNKKVGFYWDPAIEGDALALTWWLRQSEIGTIIKLGANHSYTLVNNVFTAKLTFTPNNNDYPVLYYTLVHKIELPATLPSINGFFGPYWVGEHLYEVYPVQFGSEAQNRLGNETCVFYNNLMNGFTFADNGFIVKDLNSCATWDMQFCQDSQQAGYAPGYIGAEPDKEQGSDIGGYNLYLNNSAQAAKLHWDPGHISWCGSPAHNQAAVELYKNNAGIGLLDKTSHMGIWATINPYNIIPVYNYDIKFIEPLKIETAQLDGILQDGIVEGTAVSWKSLFTMTDCFGYKVGGIPGSTEKTMWATRLADYYEVETPTWVYDDPEARLINVKFGFKLENGNVVVDENATVNTAMTIKQLEKLLPTGGVIPSLSLSADDQYLIFTSNMGSQLNQPFYMWAQVTVAYGWGAKTIWMPIKVIPMDSKQ